MTLVGDDLVNDYQAAAAAGWRSILVDRNGKLSDDYSRIANLEELLKH
jgi:FMN phosphatase YigB (HAD superfamily)